MDIYETAEFLKQRNDFLILTHIRPDGDTLCSAAALCCGLRLLGKNAAVFYNPGITEKFMPYVSKYFVDNGLNYNNIVSVDVATLDMLPKEAVQFSEKINLAIDHHGSNSFYADSSYIDATCSACGEIIWSLLKILACPVNNEIATLLYIALITDNGCFQFSNTNSASLRCGAELLDAGADMKNVVQIFHRSKSRARITLESLMMANAEFYKDGAVAFAAITLDMAKKAGVTENDTDGIASLLGNIEGIKLSITLREQNDGTCKISVRSDGSIDCNKFCEHFGGGGHIGASGCMLRCGVDEARSRLLAVTEEIM